MEMKSENTRKQNCSDRKSYAIFNTFYLGFISLTEATLLANSKIQNNPLLGKCCVINSLRKKEILLLSKND